MSPIKANGCRTVPVLLAAALPLLPGCGGSEPQPAPPGAPAKTVIGVSQPALDAPWRVQMRADMKAAAADHPELQLDLHDAAGDAARQQRQIEQFVAQGTAAIIISPVASQELTEPVAKAMDAGIPVIVLHRPLIGDKYTTLIEADNYRIGYAAGEWLAEKLGGKGRIVELKGPDDVEPGKGRHQGFRAAIRKHPDMRVLHEYPTEWEQSAAEEQMAAALETFEEIDAVYAHNDAAAYGASQAAEKAGRRNEMCIVGVGGLPDEGLAFVRQGKLDATFEHPTGGREAIDLAQEVLAGREVPKEVTLGIRVLTRDNVERGGEAVKADPPREEPM